MVHRQVHAGESIEAWGGNARRSGRLARVMNWGSHGMWLVWFGLRQNAESTWGK